jgi:lycopene beta-cyclase
LTYLQFHFVFIVPPLLLLAVLRPWRALGPGTGRFLPLLAAIAFIYTTPWDNYLVWREIWGYGNERVIGVIGYVPVEEYLFFLLQPLLTGLFLYVVLARWAGVGVEPAPSGGGKVRAVGAISYLAVAGVGAALLTTTPGTYMGLILAWAAPVLAAQWAYAGHRMAALARPALVAIAVPTLYLWFADTVAIRLGIWEISRRYTLGPRPLGLPVEEAVFFLITNILVVQGLILFLYPPGGPPRVVAGRESRPTAAAR